MVANGKSGFESLARCALNGEFFERIPVAVLLSRICADLISMDEIDLSFRCSFAGNHFRYVRIFFAG